MTKILTDEKRKRQKDKIKKDRKKKKKIVTTRQFCTQTMFFILAHFKA